MADLWDQALPCTGLGQGLEIGFQKDSICSETFAHLGPHFRYIRTFLKVNLSVHFQVHAVSDLLPLWWPKGPQREVFGEPFQSTLEVSGESENEAPV